MTSSQPRNSTLKLVHILFRHSNRSPERGFTYTNNKYDSEFPLNDRGQLTIIPSYLVIILRSPYGLIMQLSKFLNGEELKVGKRKAYQLGQLLRKKYSHLLKEGYYHGVVDARTSDCDRTKASMLLVLAGLFPPTSSETWNDELNWQPIPYSCTSINTDELFYGDMSLKIVRRLFKDKFTGVCSTETTAEEKELFKYLTEHTGDRVCNYGEVYFIYIILSFQKEHGLELPQWSRKVYPEPMHTVGAKLFLELMDSDDQKKSASGTMLKKIIDDSLMKLSRSPDQDNTKLHLYCGHDYNVAFLLITLGLFKTHIPTYLSHLVIEVHTIDGIDGIKIFYAKSDEAEPKVLKLANCGEFCPLEDFRKAVAKYLPDDDGGNNNL